MADDEHVDLGQVGGGPVAPDRPPVVGILVFDDVEVLDFAGPYEVLSATNDLAGRPYVKVVVVGTGPEVRCRGGLRIRPEVTLAACPPLDALVVPGGPGADERTTVQDEAILPFLRRVAITTPTIASVCTGAFLLGRAGLLEGHRVTTHRDALPALRAEFPSLDVVHDKVIDEGAIVTAAGVSSGIDLALHLLERWFGPEVRARGAAGLDGPWA
jgi:transcriptional regulator GlxA family with amidase domain